MGGLTESGTLVVGVEVGGAVQVVFALRPATLADAYRAIESVPVPDGIDASLPLRVAYETRVEDATILCQLIELGTLDPVPSPEALVAVLDPDDMTRLRQAADRLKKKSRGYRTSLSPCAAPNSSSSAPATP